MSFNIVKNDKKRVIIVGGAGCQYQVVVFCFTDGSLNHLFLREDGPYFCHTEVKVLSFLKNLPERERDGTGFKSG